MIKTLKSWIATYHNIEESEVESYFKNADVTGFLIIWTIFEQKIFKGFVKYEQLKTHPFDTGRLEKQISHFHNRYQNPTLYQNLRHKEESKPEVQVILSTNLQDLKTDDKCLLLLYVVYRYRNNIFHGNKGVSSWAKYATEIEYCVDVIRIILEQR